MHSIAKVGITVTTNCHYLPCLASAPSCRATSLGISNIAISSSGSHIPQGSATSLPPFMNWGR